jgi:hypothetical protein
MDLRPLVLKCWSLTGRPLQRGFSLRWAALVVGLALASAGLACGGPLSASNATATVVAASTAIELTRAALPTRTPTPPVTRTPTAGPGGPAQATPTGGPAPERTPAVAPPTRPTGG